MSCSNCFNGCTEVTSTNCSKYTGPSIPGLGIENGDSLTSVIDNITNHIISIIGGDGIIPGIDTSQVCKIVKDNLPASGAINLNQYINAIITAICSLNETIGAISQQLAQVEKAYDVCCLTGVDANSKTHEVLQATIKKVCSVAKSLSEFILEVETNYVKTSDLPQLIAEYLAGQTSNNYNSRMVPYIAYEYYGPLTNFDLTGAGSGVFSNVYLCNGQNGTPDKRGFVAVGVTTGMQGGALDPLVDPISPGNPNYTLNGTNGSNTVTLTGAQIPSHLHTATSTATSAPHSHHMSKDGPRSDVNPIYPLVLYSNTDLRDEYKLRGTPGTADLFSTSSSTVAVTVNTTVGSTGGGQSHSNIQPSKGCYYIMYIP